MVHITFPLPFQRSSNSNSLDYLSLDDLYQSLDLGEPCPLGSLCCDDTQILSTSQHTQSNYYLSASLFMCTVYMQLTNFAMVYPTGRRQIKPVASRTNK